MHNQRTFPYYRVLFFLIFGLFGGLVRPHSADAALYWSLGVRDNVISVCFVGDALTSRPDRVQQILDYIHQFELVANIQFDYWGSCPAATQSGGNDFYDGDIRVIIPNIDISGTGAIPSDGCPMFEQQTPSGYNGGNDGWGSWSNAPNDLTPNRSCLYNLKLGDDPWNDTPYLNHTLHEFGHALGLSHEHQRLDATCYDPNNDTRSADTLYMTPYDVGSVMHYKFTTASGATCDTDGNYGRNGFSDYDKLALHILYPEANRVAEFIGRKVIREGETLQLQSAWLARGAIIDNVANNFVWELNGIVVGTGATLTLPLNAAGNYTLSFSYDDFLGRHYTYGGTVRVLTNAQFEAEAAQLATINTTLMTSVQETIPTTILLQKLVSTNALTKTVLFLGFALLLLLASYRLIEISKKRNSSR